MLKYLKLDRFAKEFFAISVIVILAFSSFATLVYWLNLGMPDSLITNQRNFTTTLDNQKYSIVITTFDDKPKKVTIEEVKE